MTSIELKCRRIYEVLRTKSEFIENLSTGEFRNLEGFGITFRLSPPVIGVESDTLRSLHFCVDHTEFLPNEHLWWKELMHGEYERIVNTLYEKLNSNFNSIPMKKTYQDYSQCAVQKYLKSIRFHNARVTDESGDKVTVIVSNGDTTLDHHRCDIIMSRLGFTLVSHKDTPSELPSKWLYNSERVYRKA